MKFLLTILTVLIFGHAWSQSPDDYVKSIEKLRGKGKLTAKSSVDKTFVGSVTAYYHKDSLVLISTLTDAEAAERTAQAIRAEGGRAITAQADTAYEDQIEAMFGKGEPPTRRQVSSAGCPPPTAQP